jgi:group I intron endonuclease
LTAFLGLLKHSPKLFKTNNIKYERNIKCNTHRFNNNKIIQKRFYSINIKNTNLKISDKNIGLSIILKKLNIKYEVLYTSLHIKQNRDIMSNFLKNKQGIYMIFNLVTENYYIGSASTNRFISRFSAHLIYFTGSKLIKNSVLKYGLSNFAFIILEFYPNPINRENNKELLKLEDTYLKKFLPNYNILTEAGNSFGYRHNEEIRKKMSKKFSNERKEFIRNLNLNKKLSIETKIKLSEQALKRPSMTYETKLKCITKEHPIYLYDDKGFFLYFCPNLRLASLLLHTSYKTIQRALKNNGIYCDPKLIDYIKINKDLSIDELLLFMGIYPYIKDSSNKDLISKLYNFEINKKDFYKSTNRNLDILSYIVLKSSIY